MDHSIYYPRSSYETSRILNLYGLNRDFVLHVSSYQPKKNVERVVAAYALLKKRYGIQEKLIIVGKQPRGRLLRLAVKLGLNSREVVFAGYVPEEHLPHFYSAAKVFVFPSLHESFGMPILEAMACGTPVVTSNAFACPEVADNAALLVDPYNVKDIASAVYKVLTDDDLREELKRKGLKRARWFTWKRSALMHLKVYRSVYEQ